MKTPPTVILTRHGATPADAPSGNSMSDRIAGWKDEGLNAAGRAEAKKLGAYLADVPIDRAYSSDLARAEQTAQIATEGKDVSVASLRGLRPQNMGRWTGRLESEAEKDIEHHIFDVPGQRVPGGESFNETKRRLLGALGDIFGEAEDKGGTTLVVHHSRNFPIQYAWYKAGMNGTDVDNEELRKAPDVQPGTGVKYVKNGDGWERSAFNVGGTETQS